MGTGKDVPFFRARPALACMALLVLSSCGGDGGGDGASGGASGGGGAREERVSNDEWFEAFDAARLRFNDVIDAGDSDQPVTEQCSDAGDELDGRKGVLRSPEDDRLREASRRWVDALADYYKACAGGDDDESDAAALAARDAGEPVVARARELGYSI